MGAHIFPLFDSRTESAPGVFYFKLLTAFDWSRHLILKLHTYVGPINWWAVFRRPEVKATNEKRLCVYMFVEVLQRVVLGTFVYDVGGGNLGGRREVELFATGASKQTQK